MNTTLNLGNESEYFAARKPSQSKTVDTSIELAFDESFNVPEIAGSSKAQGFDGAYRKRKRTEDAAQKNQFEQSIRFLTGNVEKVLKWHNILQSYCIYEVIAPLMAMQEGTLKLQRYLFLKDKVGPVLKIVHYAVDPAERSNVSVGQTIRCVGRMIGKNSLHSFRIRQATHDEIATLQRISMVCDHEITKIYNT